MFANKKAQIGETMTWIVATIVIVVILIISIYISSLLGETKNIVSYDDFDRENDLLMEKSVLAYFLAGEDRTILDKIEQQEVYGNLGNKIKEVGGVLR